MSAPFPAAAAGGARASAQLRDGLLIVANNLPPAPASLRLSFDRGRARVLAEEVLEQPQLVGSAPSGGSYRFSSRADGFTVQASAAQTLARVSMDLEVLRPGKPITGRVSIPHGTIIDVSMPNGHQMLLRDGRFSIPTSAAGIGSPVSPELSVHPQRVLPGGVISVTGNVGSHCGIGEHVTLISAAFVGSAGKRPTSAVVAHEGSFVLRARIPRTRHRGRYVIRARCSGDLGVRTDVQVETGPFGASAAGEGPVDSCAPGQFDYYVCTRVSSLVSTSQLRFDWEWHSCGGINPAPPETLAYNQSSVFKNYCAVGFWGSFQYRFNGSTRMVVAYSTFTGNSSCVVLFPNAGYCTAGNSPLTAMNPNARGENWHYNNFAEVTNQSPGRR